MSGHSLSVWRDIDPGEAEGRLRTLRNRQAALEVALEHQQALRRIYPDDFGVSLSEASLISRQQKLYAEIQDLLDRRAYEQLNVVLDGSAFEEHSAGISNLGYFLIRLQKLYTSIAQALRTGPTLRGPIPTFISQATELRMAGTFPSSFGVSLYVSSRRDLIAESLTSESIDSLFKFLSASTDQDVLELSGRFGGRAFNHYRRLVSHVASIDAKIQLNWTDYSGIHRTWGVTAYEARTIELRMRDVLQESIEERTVKGTLVGGSLFRQTFEFLSEGRAEHIEGNVATTVTEKLPQFFGKSCSAKLSEVRVRNVPTGESKSVFTLTDLSALLPE